jgi:hypothetical protein
MNQEFWFYLEHVASGDTWTFGSPCVVEFLRTEKVTMPDGEERTKVIYGVKELIKQT